MGRVKSVAVKTLGDDLIAEHGARFTEDFEKNKKALLELRPIKSSRIRNVLAGYITRRMKILKQRGL